MIKLHSPQNKQVISRDRLAELLNENLALEYQYELRLKTRHLHGRHRKV